MKLRYLGLLFAASYSVAASVLQPQSQSPSAITVNQGGNVPGLTITQNDSNNGQPAIKLLGSGGIMFPDGTIQTTAGGGGPAYVAPTISLTSVPSAAVAEYGTTISSVALTAVTVKHTASITAVDFYRNAVDVYSVPSPHTGGGTETYTDPLGVTVTNTTFQAAVFDGTSQVYSNLITYTLVYPFYYGVGAQGLTGSQIQALTKLVQTKKDTSTTTSPNNQVYYFAYPQSYGSLTSILDTNGFQTISGYTLRTVTLTMLDSTNQTYNVYEFNNPTTQTSFTNTYKF